MRVDVKITTGAVAEFCIENSQITRIRLKNMADSTEPPPRWLWIPLERYLKGTEDFRVEESFLDTGRISDRCLKVYRKLKDMAPPGTTITYGELAREVKEHPRYVGYCMKINLFPLLFPCHRVVSAQGLGGFSYGVDKKEALILFEREVFEAVKDP